MKTDENDPAAPVSPFVTLVVVSIVQFLIPFMSSAVGVALPTIGREFGAGAVQLGMIQMTYLLSLVVFMLPMGRLGDIHGRKRVFTCGIVLVTLSTLALATATDITLFICWRFMQGAGASMITSTSIAILSSVFPPEKRGRALGFIAGFAYIGLAAGPPLAGMITTQLDWRWLLHLMVPFQVLALILTLARLKGEWADSRGETFDWPGAVAYVTAFSLLVIGASLLRQSAYAGFVLGAGLVCLMGFIRMETRVPMPLLDVKLLSGNRVFTLSNVAALINFGTAFSTIFLFSLYLQYVKGFTAQGAGFLLMVQPLFQALLSPIAGRWADAFSPARTATWGMVLCAAALGCAARIGPDTATPTIILVMALLGMGFGIFASPNMAVIMGSVAPRHYGTAASVSGTVRPMGTLTGMAAITMVFSLFLGNQAIEAGNTPAFVHGMSSVLMIFTAMSILGIGFCMARNSGAGAPDKDPA